MPPVQYALIFADDWFNHRTDIPKIVPDKPSNVIGARFDLFVGWAKWGALTVCVIALIIAAVNMTRSSQGDPISQGGAHVNAIGTVLAMVIVISSASAIIGFLVN